MRAVKARVLHLVVELINEQVEEGAEQRAHREDIEEEGLWERDDQQPLRQLEVY